MQYYKLSFDTISYPQVKGFGETILISDPNHLFHFLEKYTSIDFSQSPPENGPNLDYLIINPRIKKMPADILSHYLGISKGYLISEKLLNLFLEFSLQPHKVYQCRVKAKDTFYNYYYLFFYGHLGESIDFDNSPILITNLLGNQVYDILKFKNLQEYKDFYQKNYHKNGFVFQKIVLTSSIVLDMFGDFITPSLSIYISERLKNALCENKISNVNVGKLEKDYIEFNINKN